MVQTARFSKETVCNNPNLTASSLVSYNSSTVQQKRQCYISYGSRRTPQNHQCTVPTVHFTI